jgi:GNAT superfamily N-acetyltransferase
MAVSIRNGNYHISDDKSKLDVAFIHHYLSTETYWAVNIPLVVVEQAIAHSICFGVYEGNTPIGFARVITDTATFAYLADVFIIPQHRNKGLAKWLMGVIHEHPQLQGLRRWMLATRDAHALYQQFGWEPLPQPERFMQKHNPNIYQP